MTGQQPGAPAIPGVTRWRKKPVEIEARLFDPGADYDEACDVMLWCGAKADDEGCEIGTLEGVMLARPGDWIIKGIRGEFYPCKPGVFAATYEPAGAPVAASPSPAPAGPSVSATEPAAWGSDGPESSGVALIAAERARQVTAEGYTPEHDAHHGDGDLIRAAVAYATAAAGATEEHTAAWWPWDRPGFKPGDGPLRALVKAGALIAAEIDRLIDNG